MTLQIGSRLGPYEILSPLGAGGMGEVYRARDTRLERDVAIKVLPQKLAFDVEALERFEREAKAVAALSHPNILGIYDLGSESGVTYAAMELLTGETLRQRLAEGPIPQRRALDYGLQIAQGLAAAHEKGIVHRDLKPENIFLTSAGRVKILDFGLAKVVARDPDNTQSPTVAASTEPGTVMGSVGYMSPEQVRGKPADARSDIFSLGCVIYEMLSGERAFQGESAAETMAAIAQKDPPELAQPSGRFPSAIERILRHCLEKRPDERFDTAHDLAFALETVMGGAAPSGPAAAIEPAEERHRTGILVPLTILAFAAVAAAASARGLWAVDLANGRRREVSRAADCMQPSWSPHGYRIAYWGLRGSSGQRDLWTVAADGSEVTSQGVEVTNDAPLDWSPAWSPDGKFLYFSSNRGGTMNLWRVSIDEKSGQVLANPEPMTTPSLWSGELSFSRDGKRLAYASLDWRSTLLKVGFDPASGTVSGTPVPILKGAQPIRDHQVSPDGQWVAFMQTGAQEDLFVSRVDGRNTAV